ncbi:type II toxin-antitoxin system VapC family toxin [Nocardioides sp. BGMRC 2183]|nr:type II toxin-antitoxin system VapC family toxin [Nocardioides sp. BGMRC 2183]
MTGLLLDTHVLLWLAVDSPRATPAMRRRLESAPERLISAASTFEIATKVRLGKIAGGRSILDGWGRLSRQLQASELPLTAAHMARAGTLIWSHRDPFDRMLVAQAQLEGVALVTQDAEIRSFEDVRTVWS